MTRILIYFLSILWLLLLGLAVVEPTTESPDWGLGPWAGWLYIILFLGLPFVVTNLIMHKKK